jgi:hypothetical protein
LRNTLEEGVVAVGNLCISLEDSVGWGDFEGHERKGKEDIVILRLVITEDEKRLQNY